MMMMRIFHRMFAQERNTCARMCMSRTVRCVYRTGKQYTGERERVRLLYKLNFLSSLSFLHCLIQLNRERKLRKINIG